MEILGKQYKVTQKFTGIELQWNSLNLLKSLTIMRSVSKGAHIFIKFVNGIRDGFFTQINVS